MTRIRSGAARASFNYSESRLAHYAGESPEFTAAAPDRKIDRDAEFKKEQEERKKLIEQLEKNLTTAPADQRSEILRAILSAPGGRSDDDLARMGRRLLTAQDLSVSDVMPLMADRDGRVARRAMAMTSAMFDWHMIDLMNADARVAAEMTTTLYANSILQLLGRPTTDADTLAAQQRALNEQGNVFALMLRLVMPELQKDYFARLQAIEKNLSQAPAGETAERREYREALLKTVRAHPEQFAKRRIEPLGVTNWITPNNLPQP